MNVKNEKICIYFLNIAFFFFQVTDKKKSFLIVIALNNKNHDILYKIFIVFDPLTLALYSKYILSDLSFYIYKKTFDPLSIAYLFCNC